jgi:hypothetical protein
MEGNYLMSIKYQDTWPDPKISKMDDRKGYYALFDETDWTTAKFPASKYLVAQTST